LDVRVPRCGVISSLRRLSFVAEHFLSRNGADVADFIIADAKLGSAVKDWVDV
jgi:hypothetical protein